MALKHHYIYKMIGIFLRHIAAAMIGGAFAIYLYLYTNGFLSLLHFFGYIVLNTILGITLDKICDECSMSDEKKYLAVAMIISFVFVGALLYFFG